MNRFNLKKTVIAITAIFILCLLSVILFIIKNNITEADFYASVSKFDQNLGSGFYSQAEEDLPDLYSKIKNSTSALSFLKRLEKLSSATGEYTAFHYYSDKLYERYKHNLEIAAVYSYAAYMNEDYDAAFTVSDDKLNKSDYNSLFLSSVLRTESTITDSKVFEHINDEYKFFFKTDKVEAEDFYRASEFINDDRLLLDSALLLMRNGQNAEAFEYIKQAKSPINKAGMFIAYDNLDFKAAQQYYEQLSAEKDQGSAILMFGADIYMENGRYDLAAGIYNSILEKDPDFSWIIYRNLYSLDSEKGLGYLDFGLKRFPLKQELILPQAWEIYLKNGTEDLSKYSSLSSPEENDPLSELFRINILLKNRSPEHIIGNYWNIISRAPESETIAVSFANYLLRNRSFRQLELLLSKQADYNGEAAWQFLYAAVSACMQGHPSAESYIDKSLEMKETTAALYNKGVICLLSMRTEEAESWLLRAASAAEMENNAEYLSRIYYKLAETYYNNLEYDLAEKYVKKSLRIVPDDLRCSLLLNKIEEGYNG